MKKRLIRGLLSFFVLFAVLTSGCLPMDAFVVSAYAASATVAAPTADYSSGSYMVAKTMYVTLSAGKGAKIYYSLNGGNYKLYSSKLKLIKNSTIKAYAKASGKKSKVASFSYKLLPKVNISVAGGTYDSPQTVKLSSSISGVKCYYTLDGTKPTQKSKPYVSGGISISESATLKILTVKSGWSDGYLERKYVINSAASGNSSDMLSDYKSKYAYSTLTDKQKKCYAAFYELGSDYKAVASEKMTDVSKLGLSIDDIQTAYYSFSCENPQFFWQGMGFNYSYVPSSKAIKSVGIAKERGEKEIKRIIPVFEQKAAEILDKASKYMTDYDKIKFFHDEIVRMTEYTERGGDELYRADGVFCNGKAVCEGYSNAFAYLCQSVGIECICICNDDHKWNMVKLDGKWYHVDVTYDDPIVVGSSQGGTLRYDYFLKSTSTILKDRKIDNFFTIPKADRDYK